MSKVDTLRAQLAHAEEEARLEQAVAGAGAAHMASPADATRAAHDAACVALSEHRSKVRGNGVRVTAASGPAASDDTTGSE